MGTKQLPPKDCALADEDTDMRKKELENSDASMLPEKVDEFLDFINNMYFDGEMDNTGKGILKGESNGHPIPRIIYSSDNETGTSPKLARRRFN